MYFWDLLFFFPNLLPVFVSFLKFIAFFLWADFYFFIVLTWVICLRYLIFLNFSNCSLPLKNLSFSSSLHIYLFLFHTVFFFLYEFYYLIIFITYIYYQFLYFYFTGKDCLMYLLKIHVGCFLVGILALIPQKTRPVAKA